MRQSQPDDEPRPRRSRRLRALVLIASVLVTLGLVEVSLRVYAHATDQGRGLAFDPDLGWRPLPHVRKRDRFWGMEEPGFTNSRGFRDAEHALARTPGTRRVVALGDSFTFGVSVDYGERFSEFLEERIPNLEVVNLGVNGYGTDQELRLFEIEGVLYEPDDVLLLTFLGNDLDDVRYERRFSWPRSYYRLVDGELDFVPAPTNWLLALRTSSYLAEVVLDALQSRRGDAIRAPEWKEGSTLPLTRALIERLHQRTRAAGARLLVCVFYPPERYAGGRTEREVEFLEMLASLDVPWLDAFERFQRAEREGEILHAPDGHWNEAGHRAMADLIEAHWRSLEDRPHRGR